MPGPRLAAVLVAAAALALVPAGCGGSQDFVPEGAAVTAASVRPEMRKCTIGGAGHWRCGRIMVPAVRSDPGLGRQKIAFAVRRRGDLSKPSKGAIVFIEGGPGFAATNADSISPTVAVFAPFLRRHELIAIDQRGTGLSSPLLCAALQAGRVPQQKALAACAKQLGPRYQGYTTAESAADIEAVRTAIGLPKDRMILYGDSYGTYLGQSYAARYGEGLRGLILSSAYPTSGESPFWPSLYPSALKAVRLACDRSPDCTGDAVGRLKRTLKRLGTGSAFVSNILGYLMGDASSYAPNGYRRLNAAVSDWLAGDPRTLRTLSDPGPPGAGSPRYYSEGMYYATICNDYPTPWDRQSAIPDRRRQLQQEIEDFRPQGFWAPIPVATWVRDPASDIDNCVTWPAPGEEMEKPVPDGVGMPGSLDTLVLAGEFDAITTVTEARVVKERFPRGRLFIVLNRGHASELYYPFTSPATGRIRQFVSNLD
jgi:pimeloyl-ACP methyl ester carboxylesterase